MVPILVLGEIDFLAPTIPIPSDRGNRTVETFYGASLRILEIQFLVDEAPLDAVAGGKVALLLRENIDLGCPPERSEEHTSELQSLMRSSYAVFCLKKKK